jgi:gliding motility-associated-like protein
MPVIAASDTFGCGEARVKFSIGNVDADTISAIRWDFGNSTTSNQVDPDTVVYNTPGYYDVSVVINGDEAHGVTEYDLVHVQFVSPADFTYKDTVTYDAYVFEHTGALDTSATYTYSWEIGEVGTQTGKRIQVKFPVSDTVYLVTLTVTDNFGCSDTRETSIYVLSALDVQNVFTPNGDNVNDNFEVTSHGNMPLVIRIFTRTGTLVYEGKGSTLTWDGRTSWGLQLSQGIYYYVLDALGDDPSNRFHKTGFIYLYR